MNAENPSTSKFQLVTETMLPNKCIACGRSADGQLKFVDFGLSLDVEDPLYIGVPNEMLGVVYICEDCGREIGTLLGFLPPYLAEQFSVKTEEFQQELDKKDQEIERLRTLNESFVTVLTSMGAIAGDSVEEPDEVVEPEPEGKERRVNIFTDTKQ